MYTVTCDGLNLIDMHDEKCTIYNPVLTLEANTVGGFTFTIYKDHPRYDAAELLRPVVEIKSGDYCVFRGRMTNASKRFDGGMEVDVEGAMGYLNDTIVPSFDDPEDWLGSDGGVESGYAEALEDGKDVEFFLRYLIDQHNLYTPAFQHLKLGTVTVKDTTGDLYRTSDDSVSTWEAISTHLIGSSLGGYFCIRYEEDGNYIDYVEELSGYNDQSITVDTNLIDLKQEMNGEETYSAICPIGANGINLSQIENYDVSDDIVKKDHYLYSKSAVEKYGFICAPTSETTWEDATNTPDLLAWSSEWFEEHKAEIPQYIEITALDLNFTDNYIESFRMYRNVAINIKEHGISGSYPVTKMEIPLLDLQNAKIYVGKSESTFLQRTEEESRTIAKSIDELSFKAVSMKPTSDITPGTFVRFGVVDRLDITLLEREGNLVNDYYFDFQPSENFTSFEECLNISPSVDWFIDPDTMDILNGTESPHCQVSILYGIGVLIHD